LGAAILIHIGITLWIILGIVHQVEASEFFSKQTGLSCNECHFRIPRLNEMGERFKNNGYSLVKKDPAPIKPATPQADAQSTPVLKTPGSTDEKSKENKANSIPPPLPAVKTEYLYRGQSDKGSYVFSDKPLNIPATIQSRDAAKSRAVSLEKNATGARSVVKRTVKPKSAASDKARPLTYEECMEKILINVERPKNADDMLVLFARAENACALYDSTR